jgi:hypothetical protein
MARDWESVFKLWAKPPGKTEQQRCENSEKTVRNAIQASHKLKHRNIKVFSQGSYQNNTNVRKDSDVDVGVLCYSTFFYELPNGYQEKDFNIISATYKYSVFKNEVGEALVEHFGKAAVHRGNKAFNIRENSYHVEADVAPFFEYRWYKTDGSYESGVKLLPDNGGVVINWPEQHYNNGVQKNNATYRRFKALVRIIKSLCNEMADEDIPEAKPIPGFLNECLVWNVPNNNFGNITYTADVRNCLAFLFNNTITDDKCSDWGEVSELKYLFHASQKWTREQAHSFIDSAWDYIGFEG